MLRKWVIILLGCLMPFTVTGQEADADIHAELRTLLGGMQSAVNDAKYGELGQYFHDQMRVTMINQEVLKARGEIAPFFDKWFGPSRFMKRVNMTLTADGLTQLHSSKTLGAVEGSGAEDYYLSDGRFIPMKTRWTATVIKDSDGKWKILTLHIGTNFLDNPILSTAEGAMKKTGAIAGGVGLVIGALAMWFLRRKG